MAFINGTQYTGDIDQNIYMDLFFGMPTISGRHVSVLTDVKGTRQLPNVSLTGDIFKASSCDFSSTIDLNLDSRVLSVCDLDINSEICKLDAELLLDGQGIFAQPAGANNVELPPTLESSFIQLITKQGKQTLEQIVWQGDTVAGAGQLMLCDGFLAQMEDEGGTVDVSGIPLTSANIVAELTKVYEAIPDVVMDMDAIESNMRIFAPSSVKKFLMSAISVQEANNPAITMGTDSQGNKSIRFLDLPVVFTHGLPANRIVATFRENMWIGTDLESDFDEINVVDMTKTTAEKKLRMLGRVKIGTKTKFNKYIVNYAV